MTDNLSELALVAFLRTPTIERTPADYERVFDDFVDHAGGRRVSDIIEIPPGVMNADYHFATDSFDILLELKQVSLFEQGRTIDAYVAKWMSEAPTPGELNGFYKKFRPSILEQLRKASQQLKATDHLLPKTRKPRYCGVLLVNSGDFNLPLDLMYHLVEWRTKNMWKRSRFSKLDFVSCLTVDMIRQGQHPLQGRHIARSLNDPLLVKAVRSVYEGWLRYFAEAIGAQVEFQPGRQPVDSPLVLEGKFDGKVRFRHGA